MSANRYWSPIASKSRMRPARDEDSLGMRIASKSRMRMWVMRVMWVVIPGWLMLQVPFLGL